MGWRQLRRRNGTWYSHNRRPSAHSSTLVGATPGASNSRLTSHAPGEYLQPDDLSAKHAQLFVIDLLYLLAAQRDFPRTTSLLAASAAAVAPHRRPLRPAARPRTVPVSKEIATA